MKILCSIAGFDPSSGAGITLDLKVFRAFGYHGVGILTSLTAQNTREVTGLHFPPAAFIRDQYRTLLRDTTLSGIKVGMVGRGDNLPLIGNILAENPGIPRVADPVFRSGSGTWLLEEGAVPSYAEALAGRASLITPNLFEAGLLAGIRVSDAADMDRAAEKIFSATGVPCLVKGGHLPDRAVDVLYDGKRTHRFPHEKLKKKVHGTGCYLSSAVLCHLASGFPLEEACSRSIRATLEAMKAAAPLGKGGNVFP